MKITRRTQLLVVALALCFTTMIGSTFAWFTDSVEVKGNNIQAGTLDVTMEYAKGTEDPYNATWQDASSGTLFNYKLWEPGYVQVYHVKIANAGTLALKYDLKLVADGTVSKLAEVIDVYHADPAVQANSRALPGLTKISTLQEFIAQNADNATNTASGNLQAGQSHTVTLALKMREEAGNEYQGMAIGSSFNLVLNATQLMSESDSFGNDYDKDAMYPNVTLVEGSNDVKAALVAAIEAAQPGDVLMLTGDATIAGYDGDKKLIIEKNITLDLNGKTLTTECGWGGIDLKGGASIINGTINHTGNTAAIKAFQVGRIENVTINVTETAGKTKGGIVVQDGDSYVGSIKNVTINGATNGIECYRSTNANLAIGSMENVTIDATDNGIYLNGAGKIGSISNCTIKGGNIGINAYLTNLWHIALDIKNSTIEGGTSGIDIWDEAKTNTGSTVTFNYDDKTTFKGDTNNIKITLQEEITCTVNGAEQTTPCDIRE